MRVLHTADWHLGHSLHRFRREPEHAAFLTWLLDTLVEERVDALLIAGDVFDTANPPSSALRTWYGFLARARQRLPDLDVVVIGGNHDSAARLDAPGPLLDALHLHVVGGLPWTADGAVDASRMVVPLTDSSGRVAAQVLAVPFLRMADLPLGTTPAEGVRHRYTQVLEAALSRREPDQALIAMGHAYLAGTALSELSERKVLGGNQHALPLDALPADAAYVALGHLHLAQTVGDDPRVRYSGSPLPLSFTERTYRHQVVLVELDGPRLASATPLPVPRVVDLVAVPEGEPAPLDAVLAELRALPGADAESHPDLLPFVEVRVRLDGPAPGVRQQIEAALEGRAARLVRIVTTYTGTGDPLAATTMPGETLSDLSPEEVFLRRWHRDHEDPPSDEILAAFHDIVDQVHQEGA